MNSDIKLKNDRKLQNGYSNYGDEDGEDGSSSYVESGGDGSSSYSESEDYVLPASEPYVETDATSAENINPLAQDARVGPDKPVSTKGYTTDEKEYNIQIVKFHDFKEFPESGMISFSTIFYFKERIIPFSIIFRLRVTYNSDSETADSLRTNCIVEGFALQEKAGKEAKEGEIFNYYCTANVTQDINNAFIQLNTDPNLVLSNKSGEYEIFDFYEVNFIGLTKDEAMNLQDFKEEGYLPTIIRNTIVSINNSDLIFTGEIPTQRRLTSKNQELEQKQGQIDQVNQITMNLNTKENGNYNIKKYNCTQNIEETSKFVMGYDSEEAMIPVSKFDNDVPFFNMIVVSEAVQLYLKQIKRIIDSSKSKTYISPDTLMKDISDVLIDMGIAGTSSINIETLIYQMVRCPNKLYERPDFSKDTPDTTIIPLSSSIANSDIYTAFGFEKIKQQVTNVDSFLKKGSGIYDPLFKVHKADYLIPVDKNTIFKALSK
jgi:hypothetical protein